MVWLMILLGFVQGLTEFLPVSSSGHLTLLSVWVGKLTAGQALGVELAVHVGSSLAVFAVYRNKIFAMLKKGNRKTVAYLLLSALPAGLVGVLFHDQIAMLFGGSFVGFGFLLTALLLFVTQKIAVAEKGGAFTYKTAISMGLMQAVAVVPGLSRSGSTVFGGTLSGANREDVADFSFLMSVPVILGGALYEWLSGASVGLAFPWMALAATAAFLSSLIALRWMKQVIRRARYTGFIIYLTALGILTLFFRFVF